MNDDFSLHELTRIDRRFPVEAYVFIQDALTFAADSAELGLQPFESSSVDEDGVTLIERHFTGQQLCHAIRCYAINQFGYMAKVVLRSWNVRSTSHFGDLVYNMINAGLMKKSEQDRREDFDDVYQFDDVFEIEVEIGSRVSL